MKANRKQKIILSFIIISCGIIGLVLAIVLPPLLNSQITEPKLNLRVGAYQNSPKIFYDNSTQKWTGFFPDLVDYIAAKENWNITWIPGTWAECLNRLKAGEIDIMVDVAYDSDRAQLYDFNKVSTFENWGVIYTGTSMTVDSFQDLEGQTVAVMNGSVHYKSEQGIYNITQRFGISCIFVELKGYAEVFEYLDTHPTAIGVVNRLFGLQYESNYSVIQSSIFFNPVDLLFAFPKDATLNIQLIERIDYHLIALRDDSDSMYYEMLDKYFFNQRNAGEIPEWLVITLYVISAMAVVFISASAILKRQVNRRTNQIKEINQELELLNGILLENTKDPVIVIESNGKVLLLNRAMIQLYYACYNRSISLADSLFDGQTAFSKQLTAYLQAKLNPQKESNGELVEISNQLSLENGSYFTIFFSPISRAHQGVDEKRYFFFLHDITEFVNLDKLRKRFVSTVSHELRTPITSINLTLQNLVKYRTKLDEGKITMMFDMLLKSGRVMADMIDDLLIASRIESGRMKLAPAEFTIDGTVKEIIAMMNSNIQQKNIQILLDTPEKLKISGDPKRISQVLRILIDNAIKYSPQNSKIEIQIKDNPPEVVKKLRVDGILFRIKDNGIGIPASDMEHLFNQFFRASNVNQIQGTGLGLVIAKELVDLHHGDIICQSEVGTGTEFRVMLPRIYVEEVGKH